MKIKGDVVTFSTGRTKSANCGIIGLGPDMEVTGGYDEGFHSPREDWMDEEDYCGLTPAEQVELADYMIDQWLKFRVAAVGQPKEEKGE